jgi:hypothetical protein
MRIALGAVDSASHKLNRQQLYHIIEAVLGSPVLIVRRWPLVACLSKACELFDSVLQSHKNHIVVVPRTFDVWGHMSSVEDVHKDVGQPRM